MPAVALAALEGRGAAAQTPVCISLPTAPLVLPHSIKAGFEKFIAEGPDVLHSVARMEHPVERTLCLSPTGVLTWRFGDPRVIGTGTEIFPPCYRITGGFSFVTYGYLKDTGGYNSENMAGHVLSGAEAVDIDDTEGLELARAYLAQRG